MVFSDIKNRVQDATKKIPPNITGVRVGETFGAEWDAPPACAIARAEYRAIVSCLVLGICGLEVSFKLWQGA